MRTNKGTKVRGLIIFGQQITNFQNSCFFFISVLMSQSNHKKRLVLESEEGIDPTIRLFTDIPLASFDKDPVLNSKAEKKIRNVQKEYKGVTFDSPREVSTLQMEHTQTRNSLNQQREKLRDSKNNKRQASNPLKNQRIKNICKNVMKKMRMNNIYRLSIGESEIEEFKKPEMLNGWEISEGVRFCWDVLASLVMLSLFLSQTFLLVFHDMDYDFSIKAIVLLGIAVFTGEVLFNLLAVRRQNGKKIKVFQQIVLGYAKGELWLDLSILIVLILYFFTQMLEFNQLFVALFILKSSNLLSKLHRIERWIFKTLYYEQYWSLLKIILFNLAFAHTIAIALNLMVLANPNQNWQIVKGISQVWWLERYVWSYYWATTIMLTVGFGDIIPTTYHEAIWIICIEIISCIAFSYNISCLGNLISSIRSQGEEIIKNRKIFQNIAERRNLPEKLTEMVMHYIDESAQVKTRFNNVEQKVLIEQLPDSYKTKVLSASNKSLLKSLTYFNQLLIKTISELSKNIERNIYFPEETIKAAHSEPNIYILQEGEVGYACHSADSALNRVYVNLIKRTDKEKPFLLSTDFLTLVRPQFDIRSKDYSVVHKLKFEDFKAILATFPKDYEYYCYLRDRTKYIIDEYETVNCEKCQSKHTKFTCPKFHFIPLKEHVIQREIHSRMLTRNQREMFYERINRRRQNALLIDIMCEKQKNKLVSMELKFEDNYKKGSLAYLDHSESLMEEFKTHSARLSENQDERYLHLVNLIMSMEIKRELKVKEENNEDEVWLINCDKIEEYSTFFPKNNLKAILSQRKSKMRKAFLPQRSSQRSSQ